MASPSSSSMSRRWRHSAPSQPSLMLPERTDPTLNGQSYRVYLQRIHESKPYWFLLDPLLFQGSSGAFRSPFSQPSIPISILEIALDGSQKHFKYETYQELQKHLKTPVNPPSRGRRVILVTDLRVTVLEVLGDVYGMDFGFFADHLIPDEYISYTRKTTRGNHHHILEEKSPPSERFQFEYRELSRFLESAQSIRNVCRVFDKSSDQPNWDAIFQRRFSMFSHNPSDEGWITDIYLFDEHAFQGAFALGIPRLDLPSFIAFRDGDSQRFERSLGLYPEDEIPVRDAQQSTRSPFQDELIHFFNGPDFDPILALEDSSYIVNHVLKLTLVMWRNLLVKLEHSLLARIENRVSSNDNEAGSLSSVSAELSKCVHLVSKKTVPMIRALCRHQAGEANLAGVLEEYITLCDDLEHVAARAEKAQTIMLSTLSIQESQKAIEQSVRGIELAKRVGRLTKLAFVFIPLSFVTSFLGMMQFDGNFSDQTKRVFWIFLVMSLPLLLITVFLAVPEHISSVISRWIYLIRRRLSIGWVYDEINKRYYLRTSDPWNEYYRWLCSVGWESKEGTRPKELIVIKNNGGSETQVGFILGTWLHLGHAWQNVR